MLMDHSNLYSEGEPCATMTYAHMRTVKQLLQLLTLVWTSGTSPRSIPQSTQRFLSSLARRLENADTDSLVWRMLGDAFVGVVIALEQRRADPIFAAVDRFWDELAVWKLAKEADPSELPFACESPIPPRSYSIADIETASFALYVATMAHSRYSDDLLRAEAWDYLRDVLLLILTREHEGLDEPLALLVAPSFCRALIALLANARGSSRTSLYYACAAIAQYNP